MKKRHVLSAARNILNSILNSAESSVRYEWVNIRTNLSLLRPSLFPFRPFSEGLIIMV